MKTLKVFSILLAVVSFFVIQQGAEAQHIVQHNVFGNGGSVISDNSYSIGSTVGQPVIGIVSGSSYNNHIGFWYLSRDYFTSVGQMLGSLPTKYWVGQNYPNPFNPTTTIQFGLPKTSYTSIKLFDILGREIMVLIDRKLRAGEHKVVLNAQDFSSGVYFYRIRAGDFIQTKRLVLLR